MKKLQTSIRATKKSFLLSRAALVVQSGGRCKWTCKCWNASALHHRMRLLRFLLIPSLVSQLLELVEFCCWKLFLRFDNVKTEKTHFPSHKSHLRAAVYFKVRPAPARHPWIFVDDLLIHSRANGYVEYKHSELSTTSCGGGRKWTSYTHSFNEVWMGPNFTLEKKENFFSSSRFRIHFPNCWDFSSPIRFLCHPTSAGARKQSLAFPSRAWRRSGGQNTKWVRTRREKISNSLPPKKQLIKIWISYLDFSSWTLPRCRDKLTSTPVKCEFQPAREKKFESFVVESTLGRRQRRLYDVHTRTLSSLQATREKKNQINTFQWKMKVDRPTTAR